MQPIMPDQSTVSVLDGSIMDMSAVVLPTAAVRVHPPVRTISRAAARRIAVAAQGLHRAKPFDSPPATRAQVVKAATGQGLLQIDSVNVLARAHYLPVYSRLGVYPTEFIDEAAWPAGRRRRSLVEGWAHEASLVPLDVYRLLWWRRRDHALGRWGSSTRLADEHPDFVDDVFRIIAGEGPISAGQVEKLLARGRGEGGWWGWSATKTACEVLFAAGRIATAHRRSFERYYDITERVIPAEVLAGTLPAESDAKRQLVEIAARKHGIGTAADLADYFRLKTSETLAALDELIEQGVVQPVSVPGWKNTGYLHTRAKVPRSVDGAALLCPFDPLIWFRRRTERIFDFHYRIEIYTPSDKRVHGYYVFPLLVGDSLVGRFDLKADRAAGDLLVQSAWLEPSQHPGDVADNADRELRRMADWLGLDRVVVRPRGDLAQRLAGLRPQPRAAPIPY